MHKLAEVVPELLIDGAVWETAYDLARQARAKGVTVPAIDLIIAASALRHGATLESSDTDFDLLSSVCGRIHKRPTAC